jgi:LPXTG-motif cell wall-anchored protein
LNLMLTEMKNNGSSIEEINSTKVDMDQMFTTLKSQEFLDEFNQIMDKLKDVNILGDKGIDITYTVDENGYVISTKGVIELVADMAKIEKAFGESANVTETEVIPTGIYTVGIYFEENNSNINEEVDIVLPTLTSENSFTMEELLGELQLEPEAETEPQPQPVIVTETITGGELPKTSTHLYELLIVGAVLTMTGALTWRSRKRYE